MLSDTDAAVNESNPRVQIEYALVLGESDSSEGLSVLADYARLYVDTPWMADAILSSIHGRNAELLAILADDIAGAGRFLHSLAKSIF
ncbi:MAG: hypothetical protein ACJ07L_04105 [Opitutales bacterium]